MFFRLKIIIPVAMVCLLFSTASSALMYRYKDEAGRTVMAASVPPQFVKKGYEILNQQGRVIEVIPPELTPEQIAERDRKLEEERRRAAEIEAQKEYDKQILRQYGTPDDAVNILKRRLEEIDALLASRRNSITLAEKTIAENEELAANAQRNGRKIPTRILQAIEKAHNDIASSEQLIEEKTTARAQVIEEFRQLVERLEYLTGKSATDFPESSNSDASNPENS